MKFINDCLVLNKEDTDKIIPILVHELEFNCIIFEGHRRKIRELNPASVTQARNRIETLMPFFAEYMSNTGAIDDHECKQIKNMSIEMFAEYMYERYKSQKEGLK